MLYKKGTFKTFRKIHRKTPAAESVFNEVARLQLDKNETPKQVFSCAFWKKNKNFFFP